MAVAIEVAGCQRAHRSFNQRYAILGASEVRPVAGPREPHYAQGGLGRVDFRYLHENGVCGSYNALTFEARLSGHLRNLAPITNRCHAGDNVGMDAGDQLATEILDAISSGRDLYVFDQFIQGPHRLERSRKVLIEKRDACSDPDEAAFLTSIIRGLEKG